MKLTSDIPNQNSLEPPNQEIQNLLAHYNQGNFEIAIKLADELSKRFPKNPFAFKILGAIYARQGDPEKALISMNESLLLSPSDPEIHNNRGRALSKLGRIAEAQACFREAILLKPDYITALFHLGNLLVELGHLDEAKALYQKTIKLQPDHTGAHNNLGNVLMDLGNKTAAIAHYQAATQLNPHLADPYRNLSICMSFENPQTAFELALVAHQIEQSPKNKRLIVKCLNRFPLTESIEIHMDLIIKALQEGWPGESEIMKIAQDMLLKHRQFHSLIEQVTDYRYTIKQRLLHLFDAEKKISNLFALILASAPISNFPLEIFLKKIRRELLIELSSNDLSFESAHSDVIILLSQIAQQCYINEYIWTSDEDEIQIVSKLKNQLLVMIQSKNDIPDALVLLVASYKPLLNLSNSEWLIEHQWTNALNIVIEQQILQPLEERTLGQQIPQLTLIEDDISLDVKDQYEKNPYPRWTRYPQREQAMTINQSLRGLFRNSDFEILKDDKDLSILIAGCGTGRHAIDATRIIHKEILAIDLSLPSLAYARRKALEMEIHSITFAQADILKLGQLNRTFDVIESAGVLHHMRDLYGAWDILLARLNPNGVMKIGLYSAIARRYVSMLREQISGEGILASPSEISNFRQKCLQSPHPENYGWVTRSTDFFSTSACRDLLFHVHEHQVSLPAIKKYLACRNLRFLGFEIDNAIIDAYKNKYPNDLSASNLDQWDLFEKEHRDIFVNMYQFWVQKKVDN